MKKILSFLLLAAMLVGCMIPAFTVSADAGFKVEAADAEYMQGTAGTNVAVTIADNTAVNTLTVAVFYNTADFESVDASFADTLFNADDCATTARKGTHNSVKSYITAAGLTPADCSALVVDLAADDDVTANGKIFDIVAKAATAIGTTAEIYVAVIEAYDYDGNDAAFVADADKAAVSVVADPYLGKYTDTTVFAAAEEEIALGADTVDVQIRIDANPSIWSTRVFLAYTAGWEITDVKNGSVFPAAAFSSSNYSTNVAMTEEYKYPFSDAFAEYGINAAGKLAAVAFFDPEDPGVGGNVSGNGTLLVVTFKVPETAKAGDKLTIELATINGDTIVAETDGVKALDNPTLVGAEIKIACDHATTTEQTTPAECEKDGKKDTVCTVCGEVLNSEVITAPGHNMENDGAFVDATCKDDGYQPTKCTVCGETGKTGEVPATGLHAAGEPSITPATCEVDGVKITSCIHCGTEMERETIPATGHNFVADGEPVPATCTEEGYHMEKCSVCEEPKRVKDADALGHNEVVDEKASTCTVAGYKTVSCDRCGIQISHEDYELKAHTPGAPGLGKPTCTEDFVQITRCNVCGTVVDETVYPATNHPTREDVEYVYPTCNADGKWVFNCTDCGVNNIVEVVPKEQHEAMPGDPVKVDATYDADGSITITCTDCEEVISTEVLPRLTVELTVNFVDKDGKAVADAVVVKDLYKGDKYDVEANEIDGYKLTGDDKVTVELKETDNVVTFVYEKVAADDKPQAPQTGDAMMFIIIAMAVVALGAAAVVVIRRNKKEN